MQKRVSKKRGGISVVLRACERCKIHHKKCNGVCPCDRCLEANETCVFPNMAEEDVFEQMTKQNETLKIKIMCNEQYETSLKADQQQKMRELDRIQAKIAFVRNKIAKFFSIPHLSTYVYWYSQTIGAMTGAVVPYPDLDTLLQDDDLLKNALMMSVIGCGALINNDIQTAQKCMKEASEFATQYELGDELLFNEEMSLLFNLAFYALSIGDWKQSASVWKRLSGLRATRTDLGKVSALPVNKAKQDQEEIDGDSTEDHLLHILTFSIPSTRVKDRRSDPQFPKISEFNFGTTSSSKLAQDLRDKARAVVSVGASCMRDGTKLNQTEVHKYLSDLIQQASLITENTLRDIIGLSIQVAGVFAFNACDQLESAIQCCHYIINVAKTLIAQMPHFIFPYIYVFSILPFLKLTKQVEMLQNIAHMFSNSYYFLARLFWHQYNQLLNDQPLLPFLANFFKRPLPPDLQPNSPPNEPSVGSPSIAEVSLAVNCTSNQNAAEDPTSSASNKDFLSIGHDLFTQSSDSRVSS